MAAILKTVISLYLIRHSSGSDEIWQAGANFDSKNGHIIKDKNLPIQDGSRTSS